MTNESSTFLKDTCYPGMNLNDSVCISEHIIGLNSFGISWVVSSEQWNMNFKFVQFVSTLKSKF